MVVTSAPDLFDGYQWRKYGQKLIEGAMYPRFVGVTNLFHHTSPSAKAV